MNAGEILRRLQDTPFLLSELIHALTLATTVIVVAVPEGLPMMISVVLSANIHRMQRDRVLVRNACRHRNGRQHESAVHR